MRHYKQCYSLPWADFELEIKRFFRYWLIILIKVKLEWHVLIWHGKENGQRAHSKCAGASEKPIRDECRMQENIINQSIVSRCYCPKVFFLNMSISSSVCFCFTKVLIFFEVPFYFPFLIIFITLSWTLLISSILNGHHLMHKESRK